MQLFGVNKDGVRSLEPEQIHELRNQAFGAEAMALVIGINTGISFTELIGISKSDVNAAQSTIFIRGNKKSRVVYFTPAAMEDIKRGLVRLNGSTDYLFPFTEQTFKGILRKWSGIAGFEITWSNIRHTYAELAARQDIPVKLVAHNIGVTEKELDRHYDLTPNLIGLKLQERRLYD